MIWLWLALARSHHLSSQTLPTSRERRESCDETGVLDEDDPHFVHGPGKAPHSSGLCLLCDCMLRAGVDGGESALGSDSISRWDVLDIAMVVSLLPLFFFVAFLFLLPFLSLSPAWGAVKKECERIRDRRRSLGRSPPSLSFRFPSVFVLPSSFPLTSFMICRVSRA